MRRGYWMTAAVVLGILGVTGCGGDAGEHNGTQRPYLRGKAVPGTRSAPSPSPSPTSRPRSERLRRSPAPVANSPEEREMMERMGIDVEPGRIRIDTRKARHFFETVERELRSGVDRGIEKAKEHQRSSGVTDLGIHVGNDRIEIDLNRTKRFMKIWAESMKLLGEEVEQSLRAP